MSSVKSTLHPACLAAQDQTIPKGKAVKAVQIDRCQDICDFGGGYVEFGKQFDLAAGNADIHLKLARDGDEIFLQHLQRHDPGLRAPVLGDKF
jgi:hypothetical protein